MLPLRRFSKRQLSGAGKCAACAANASAENVASQAQASRKRQLEECLLWGEAESSADPEEKQYVQALLASVESARRVDAASDCARGAAHAASQAMCPLDSTNRGRQMLERLGWEPGEGLGARRDGNLFPLTAEMLKSQRNTSGLGSVNEELEPFQPPLTRISLESHPQDHAVVPPLFMPTEGGVTNQPTFTSTSMPTSRRLITDSVFQKFPL